jgi:hypothetical protein
MTIEPQIELVTQVEKKYQNLLEDYLKYTYGVPSIFIY